MPMTLDVFCESLLLEGAHHIRTPDIVPGSRRVWRGPRWPKLMYVSRMCVSMVCTVSAVRNGRTAWVTVPEDQSIYIDLAMSRSKIKMSEHTRHVSFSNTTRSWHPSACASWSRSSPPTASPTPRRPSTRPSTTPTSRGEARAQAEAQGRGGGNRLNALETQLAALHMLQSCKRGDRRVLKTYRTGASTKPLAPAPNHWRHFPRSLVLHSRFFALSYCYCSHQKG
jgi:hypothetical protein